MHISLDYVTIAVISSRDEEYNFIAVRLVNLFKVFQVADNQCSGKNITLAAEFRV